jgi:hypothetical protein
MPVENNNNTIIIGVVVLVVVMLLVLVLVLGGTHQNSNSGANTINPAPLTLMGAPDALSATTTVFAVFNLSTVINTTEVNNSVNVIQAQTVEDFAPAWGVQASFIDGSTYTEDGAGKVIIPVDVIPVFIVDSGSYDNAAIAYHDNQIPGDTSTLPDPIRDSGVNQKYLIYSGCPFIVVYAINSVSVGGLSVPLSHEILETLADPLATSNVLRLSTTGGVLSNWWYEVCDALQYGGIGAGSYMKTVDGVTEEVANFVYPNWFNANSKYRPTKPQYDFLNYFTNPFQTIGSVDMTLAGTNTAAKADAGLPRRFYSLVVGKHNYACRCASHGTGTGTAYDHTA